MRAMVERLRAMAGMADGTPEPGRDFVDEAGHRRPVDRPFLAWRAHRAGAPAGDFGTGDRAAASADVDVVLWSALLDPRVDVDAALARWRGAPAGRTASDGGALFPHHGRTPIEVWTEVELSCLQALWWLALERRRDDWHELVERTARWHVQNLQPDNATNHPWAVHVFLLMGERGDGLSMDARLYAGTLLHNCMVGLGRPDRLSAQILADAGDAIDAHCDG